MGFQGAHYVQTTDGFRPPAIAERARSYRSIWISDFHLGTRRCRAAALLDFLRHHRADYLYLVGDIVDGWSAPRCWYWDPPQAAVIDEIARWRRHGTYVQFIAGNHDECRPELAERLLSNIPACGEVIHRTAEGRRMLVIHGHQFERSVTSGRWLAGRGPAYAMALQIDEWCGREWAERSRRPRSLSVYFRSRLKRAVKYLTDFDDRAVFEAAQRHHADGVICGHIHRAEQRLIGPIWYINDGDWVENQTALVEDYSGGLRLLKWHALERCGDDRWSMASGHERSGCK